MGAHCTRERGKDGRVEEWAHDRCSDEGERGQEKIERVYDRTEMHGAWMARTRRGWGRWSDLRNEESLPPTEAGREGAAFVKESERYTW